jgi:hypothetical protein
MTMQEWIDAFNRATPEQCAQAMERCDTATLEWAVKFEGLAGADSDGEKERAE